MQNQLQMVNTFLTSSDFTISAKLLDNKRLFKQCVEAKQIVELLTDDSIESKKGFINHPAVIQWKNHVPALKHYFNCHLEEVFFRGHWKTQMVKYQINEEIQYPWFVDCQQLHYSHMASLSRKNPDHYAFLTYPKEYMDHGYIWPSHLEAKKINLLELDKYALSVICHPPMKTNRKQCEAILKSGKNKNNQCSNRSKNGLFCGVHSKNNPAK